MEKGDELSKSNEEITIVQKQRELAVEARKKLNLVSPARDIDSTSFGSKHVRGRNPDRG